MEKGNHLSVGSRKGVVSMKKALVALGTAFIAMIAVPAQATVIAEIHQLETTLRPSGNVKVIGEVQCADGYEITLTSAVLSQNSGGTLVEKTRHFSDDVSCSGAPDRFTVRFRPDAADPWTAEDPAQLDLSFTACPEMVTRTVIDECINGAETTTHLLSTPVA